jgi:hypothetical protein
VTENRCLHFSRSSLNSSNVISVTSSKVSIRSIGAANDKDHRPRASGVRFGTAKTSRGSVDLFCLAI